ncbi:MAG TPA: EamA family transporter [Saprospiraceae bacterium]|nr:EamA family transporter [Saprospiraceae bacterium]
MDRYSHSTDCYNSTVRAYFEILLLNYEKSDANAQTTQQRNATMWIFPIATFLGSCVIDSGFYYIEKNNFADNGDIGFIATLFLFTSIYGLIILFFRLVRQQSIFAWNNVVAGIALGIPNFFAIYLLILALQQGWGGSVVFPVNNVGILVLSAFFGILIFRERITGYRITGFLLALTSILLITY